MSNPSKSFQRARAAYESQLPPGYDLPEPDDCKKCEGTGRVDWSDCCEEEIFLVGSTYVCKGCNGDCDKAKCPECDGEGVVYPEVEEDYEPED